MLRNKGTEPPRTGKYDKFFEKGGEFVCGEDGSECTLKCTLKPPPTRRSRPSAAARPPAGCATPLYTADSKFNSGCGWPAFDQEIPGRVERHSDSSMGMTRTEITCAACGGHLGHEFVGEKFTETNSRHCVNSISIKWKAAE